MDMTDIPAAIRTILMDQMVDVVEMGTEAGMAAKVEMVSMAVAGAKVVTAVPTAATVAMEAMAVLE